MRALRIVALFGALLRSSSVGLSSSFCRPIPIVTTAVESERGAANDTTAWCSHSRHLGLKIFPRLARRSTTYSSAIPRGSGRALHELCRTVHIGVMLRAAAEQALEVSLIALDGVNVNLVSRRGRADNQLKILSNPEDSAEAPLPGVPPPRDRNHY